MFDQYHRKKGIKIEIYEIPVECVDSIYTSQISEIFAKTFEHFEPHSRNKIEIKRNPVEYTFVALCASVPWSKSVHLLWRRDTHSPYLE